MPLFMCVIVCKDSFLAGVQVMDEDRSIVMGNWQESQVETSYRDLPAHFRCRVPTKSY